MALLSEGESAPAFEVPDSDGQMVTLEGLRGRWVVLWFYPRADTPG